MDGFTSEIQLFGSNFTPATPDDATQIDPYSNFNFTVDVEREPTALMHEIGHILGSRHVSGSGLDASDNDGDGRDILFDPTDDLKPLAKPSSLFTDASESADQIIFETNSDTRDDGDIRSEEASGSANGSFGHFSQTVWADTRSTPSDGYFVRNDSETVASDDIVSAFDLVGRDGRPSQGHDFDQVINGTNDDDVLIGGDGSDLIFGFYGNDLIHGGDGDDVVVGVYGYNTIYGDQGDDEVVGGFDNDDLFGGFGNDELHGEDGNDEMFGNEDHDFLIGGGGNDELFGGEGHDVLVGGLGLDELTGGSGSDIFRWGGNWDGGKDTVTDFEIDVDQFQFVEANGQSSFFDTNPGDSVSDVLTAFDNGNDTELLANTATDGWIVIANLENIDHEDIQQRIDDGSILYDFGDAAFDTPDVLLG